MEMEEVCNVVQETECNTEYKEQCATVEKNECNIVTDTVRIQHLEPFH